MDALAPHGLTLQNYASISEQQLGGFLQVRAFPSLHGCCRRSLLNICPYETFPPLVVVNAFRLTRAVATELDLLSCIIRYVRLVHLQAGAHGTGATIPPVDEQVVGMKLVTPSLGTLELSTDNNPALFRMTKVGARMNTRVQFFVDHGHPMALGRVI